jgi:hypothetical protein
MNLIKSVIGVLILFSVSNSQNLNLSGTVKDNNGNPVAGVKVILEKSDLTTTTDAEGDFTLDKLSSGVCRNLQNSGIFGYPSIHNQQLSFNLEEVSNIEITSYNINGRLLTRIITEKNKGSHKIDLPHFSNGIYLLQVKLGNRMFLIKNNTLSVQSIKTIYSNGYNSLLSKSATISESLIDTIKVSKEGYFDNRFAINCSDSTGLALNIIDTTVYGLKYFPLGIGNYWVYDCQFYNNGPSEHYYIKIVTDSVYASNGALQYFSSAYKSSIYPTSSWSTFLVRLANSCSISGANKGQISNLSGSYINITEKTSVPYSQYASPLSNLPRTMPFSNSVIITKLANGLSVYFNGSSFGTFADKLVTLDDKYTTGIGCISSSMSNKTTTYNAITGAPAVVTLAKISYKLLEAGINGNKKTFGN